MTFEIPNIFIAGKKASAKEVNDNFQAIVAALNNTKVKRCETCKGTGEASTDKDASFGKFMSIPIRETRCWDCGGSGCKWINDESEEN